jgi:hypothetical protein
MQRAKQSQATPANHCSEFSNTPPTKNNQRVRAGILFDFWAGRSRRNEVGCRVHRQRGRAEGEAVAAPCTFLSAIDVVDDGDESVDLDGMVIQDSGFVTPLLNRLQR